MNTSYNYADFIGLNLDSNLEQDSQDDEIATTSQADKNVIVQISLRPDKPSPLNTNN